MQADAIRPICSTPGARQVASPFLLFASLSVSTWRCGRRSGVPRFYSEHRCGIHVRRHAFKRKEANARSSCIVVIRAPTRSLPRLLNHRPFSFLLLLSSPSLLFSALPVATLFRSCARASTIVSNLDAVDLSRFFSSQLLFFCTGTGLASPSARMSLSRVRNRRR